MHASMFVQLLIVMHRLGDYGPPCAVHHSNMNA